MPAEWLDGVVPGCASLKFGELVLTVELGGGQGFWKLTEVDSETTSLMRGEVMGTCSMEELRTLALSGALNWLKLHQNLIEELL